jgi:hypothetical protein
MSSNDAMNRYIRESRSTPSFGPDATPADINRAIREAAGYGPLPEPQQPAQPAAAEPAAYTPTRGELELLDSEPVPGVATVKQWESWCWQRDVLPRLDQAGRLPGERGYTPGTTGPNNPDGFDLLAAVTARRNRWKRRGQF